MSNQKNLIRTGLPTLALLSIFTTGCSRAGQNELPKVTVVETTKIAEEAFIYGYPMVMNYGITYEFNIDKSSSQFKAPFNQLSNDARVFTPKDTTVVTPNSDTPYSMVNLDLRAEPMVICVPKIEKNRYYSVQLIDYYTFNFGYIGSRATGNGGGCYAIASPKWTAETPAGIAKVIHSGTDFSFVIFRTQLFNPADIGNVKKIQAGYKVEPLSQFLKQSPPAASPAIDWPKFTKEEAQKNFFAYLNFVLQFCPEVPEEKELRARFAQIGIEPGKPFDFEKLTVEDQAAFGVGMKAGLDKITKQKDSLGKNINGWQVGAAQGDRAFYKGDWLLRAAAAMAGIYGNSPAEATYPITTRDVSGDPLDGSKHKYTITFAAGQLPPVNAFWSVTMYDGKTQLLIENPINRYLINSPMLPGLKKNPDGSITLYIQNATPSPDKKSNWLPAPNGPIYMVMRLYWPKETPPSILPPGAGTWNPPPLKVEP